ncbi:MAG: hypothetical protein ACTSR1_06165 [Candidatus Heimdallarchaeota archaeon]
MENKNKGFTLILLSILITTTLSFGSISNAQADFGTESMQQGETKSIAITDLENFTLRINATR